LASAKFYSLCVSITIIMLYMQCASAADHHLLYVNRSTLQPSTSYLRAWRQYQAFRDGEKTAFV